MAHLILSLLARFLMACICTYLVWVFLGLVFQIKGHSADHFAVTALTALAGGPIFWLAFAKLIFRALDGVRNAAKFAHYRDVNGNYHAFKGHEIKVHGDHHGHPWICASDVRNALGQFPADAVLLALLKEDAELRGRAKDLWLKAAALEAYFEKSAMKNSVDFKNWLKKSVLLPASRRRGEPQA